MDIGAFIEAAASGNPTKPFLYFDNEVYTYRAFDQRINQAARAFQRLGVGPGDRVCLMLGNCPEFLFAWFGLNRIGATVVPINTGFKVAETQYILGHSEAVAAVSGPEYAETLAVAGRSCPSLRAIVAVGGTNGLPDFNQLLDAESTDSVGITVDPDTIATFIYTSGTTGRPKAVMQTHRTYVLTGEAFPYWNQLGPDDRFFVCLPLFHINAQAYSVMGCLGAGGSLALVERFSASRFWEQVRRFDATQFNLLGTMLMILYKQSPTPSDTEHRVRSAYTAPAPPAELHAAIERRYNFRLVAGYGLSESTFGTVQPVTGNRGLGSMGRPRQHPDPQIRNELRIVNDRDQEVPTGESGEIILRNPAVMKGYFKDPERTAEALAGGWLHTGDVGYVDADGFVWFVDRKKDIIRRRGENVSSVEVEEVLNQHPSVLESAVIAIPSELGEDDVKAFVVLRPGRQPTSSDLIDWCAERLARFKVPIEVEIRTSLPKTPTGRVAKRLLRDEPRTRVGPG